jgi:hypothetical protein
VQFTETATLFLVHDNKWTGANLNLRYRLRHGNDCIRTACRAIERVHQLSYPVSLQVICLSYTYSQIKLFWKNDCSARCANAPAHIDKTFDNPARLYDRTTPGLAWLPCKLLGRIVQERGLGGMTPRNMRACIDLKCAFLLIRPANRLTLCLLGA